MGGGGGDCGVINKKGRKVYTNVVALGNRTTKAITGKNSMKILYNKVALGNWATEKTQGDLIKYENDV